MILLTFECPEFSIVREGHSADRFQGDSILSSAFLDLLIKRVGFSESMPSLVMQVG